MLLNEQRVRQRLRRSERVRKKRDFDRIFQAPRIIRGGNFRIYFLKRECQGPCPVRAAFVAGKKVGNSVVRNRIKRLLREAFRRVKNDMRQNEGLDIVFVANRDFSRNRSPQVEIEMRELLARLEALSATPGPGEGGA